MNKYLRMVFKTAQDKKVTIRISAPKENLAPAEVKDVMDLIVENNVIYAATGDLVAIDGAFVVETTTTELDLNS